MNYLSGAFRYVARGETEPQNNVPRLIDRIKTSVLPHDRRNAIVHLKEAAKSSPERQVEVGELGLKVLYAIIEQDVDYDETIKAALDLLITICGRLDPPQVAENPSHDPAQQAKTLSANRAFEEATSKAAATNVDVFLGLPNALSLLLQLLEKGDFYIKFGTIELLTAMAANSRQTLQMAVLEAAQGVTRICDLLDDTHRHIRSNAVLLLSTLCEQSPEICKIIAFGGVLEKLFGFIDSVVADSGTAANISQDDVDDEDSLEAGIVIQDVLLVVRNLVTGAKTTKTFFRDTGCLQRLVAVTEKAAKDAGMSRAQHDRLPPDKVVGLTKAIQRQAKKNLNIAMNCITDLVIQGDEETQLIKNDLCNTKVLNTLANVAFFRESGPSEGSQGSETVLSTRVSAFRTISGLIRGHDSFRQAFAHEQCQDGPGSEMKSIQVATMNAMLRESSAAIRLAAYTAIRDSFVVDSGLDLPSSALLSALVDTERAEGYPSGETGNASHPSLSPRREIRLPDAPANFVAATLKEVLVGYPLISDPAGVFYAASMFSWVLRALQGAKERLLGAHVNGSALLPQIIRLLGKVERERGAAEVRISLFSLLCEWLYGSSAAVSAFLSSAMHLPMLVDILRSSGSRGDIAEVHTRGLSAVVLGICLHAADGAHDATTSDSILSNGRGPPIVIPRSAIREVIRNRIGVTAFTSYLDDLRVTKAFSTADSREMPWESAEGLVLLEARNGFLCLSGSVGHEKWYSKNTVDLVNNVYQSVGEKVLDLVSDADHGAVHSTADGTKMLSMNGHADTDGSQDAQRAVLADSARDEVINSYKEFIRKQDESLNMAKRQVEELTAALRQTQLELDKASSGASISKDSEHSTKAKEEREELLSQKEALESLLEEKTADFEALSNAFAALEAEHTSSQGLGTEHSEEMAANVQQLRMQNESLKNSLDSEIHKNEELTRQASLLDVSVKSKDAELHALASERDALKTNAHPEVVETLQWRTRAQVAESKNLARQELVESYQNSNAALQDQLREIERTRDEALTSVTSLTKRLNSTKSELESLRATRKLELQVSREATAASDASAMNEIASLKKQLTEARENLQKEIAAKAKGPRPGELDRFEQMQSEYHAVVNAYEKMKTELVDSKQAVVQWQKRAEASESARQHEVAESNRVVDHARSLEEQIKELNDALVSQKQACEASTSRVSELEEQCKEIDEIRRHTEEELITLKEQLASRTEQSIRLSGQLYELEESKEKLEEEIETLRAVRSSSPEARTEEQPQSPADSEKVDPKVEEFQVRLSALQEELDVARDALADSKDRENLSHTQARDRDAMIAKIDSLEQGLSTTRAEKEKLDADISILKERLLSLDEAEESKRALTMQVVSLQESLALMSKHGISSTQDASTGQDEKVKGLEAEVDHLRIRCDEKDMRLEGLESSLTLALDRTKTAEREKKDMEKQVSETETMFSVLRSERDSLTREKEELQVKLEELSPLMEEDTSHLEELQKKLTDAERMRDAVSHELASLVAACKVSERESRQLKDDTLKLNESLTNARQELSEMQNECKKISLSRNVDDVVSTVVVHASLRTQALEARQAIETLRLERDEAVAAREAAQTEVQRIQSEMAKLPFLVKERNEATSRNQEQSNRIAALSQELVGLQVIVNERDELAASLDAAEASIDELAEQKAAAVSALEEASARLENVKETSPESARGGAQQVDDTAIQRRVQELEEALRDAARTVTATNSELMAAQSLLVDLSADKTAMRTALSAAQEQINELLRQVSKLSGSTQAVPALSEVSEPENNFGEDASISPASVIGEEVIEGTLQSVQAEASNLRTALQRSMSEADSLVDLVINIEARIAEVEVRLKESHLTATSSQKSADNLNSEVQRLRDSHRAEKESFVKDADHYKARIRDLESEVEQTKEIWKETLSMSEESWSAERGKLENELTDLRNKLNKSGEECNNLQNKLEDTIGELEGTKENVEELEVSKQRLSLSLNTLEEERSSLKKLLESSNRAEKSLEGLLQNMKAELQSAKESFETDRRRIEEHHRSEVKDLEDELDRASSSLENAEREFRDTEVSLKEQITYERANVRDLEQEQTRTQESLRSAQTDIQRISSQKRQLETTLKDTVRQKDLEISGLNAEKKIVKNSATVMREECVNLRKTLRDTEAILKRTKRELEEEIERKTMLESENQDFLSTIKSLESSSKRVRSEIAQKTKDLNETENRLRDLQSDLEDKAERMKDMEREIAEKNVEMRLLKDANAKLETLKNELSNDLKSVEDSRDSLEQDNKDLLAWVSDLEKRATELQSAASDFQEVEQNLRDALESQRYASQQNSKLVEELRKERNELSTARAKVIQVEREREAAQAERDSSKRRAKELEARIREIRENNLVKFSQSEDAIRAKARQCAELETALAVSERKVAELESVSDDLFGATTSLKQLSEEMSALRERALAAEETAEGLRKDLQTAQEEISEVREHSSRDALRSLEAEHNELLVYLADLELEVTNLREELGRE